MKLQFIALTGFFALANLAAPRAFCQLKAPLDKSFVEKTIDYYYTREARKNKGASVFFIEADSINKKAKTDYGKFKVRFLTADEASAKIPMVRSGDAHLDRIMVKWITLDTIDVVITGCTIGERKAANGRPAERFLTNCTEAFVDVPTCRFVYDRRLMKWTQIHELK